MQHRDEAAPSVQQCLSSLRWARVARFFGYLAYASPAPAIIRADDPVDVALRGLAQGAVVER